MLSVSSSLFGLLVNDYDIGTIESVKLFKSNDLNEKKWGLEKYITDKVGRENYFSHFSKLFTINIAAV
jgi:hypothetical protein